MVKRILAATVWLAVAVLIALGGAGVVAAMNHVPATAARPELTWEADEAASAKLDEATDHLETLTGSVESLGSYGRQALAAVVAGDVDEVNQLVAAGTLQLGTIDTATKGLEASLDEIPDVGNGSELVLSPEVQDRYEGLVPTPDFTHGLDDDWRTFTGRALDAANLNALLARHDQETAAAAQQGVKEKYPQALLLLDVSDATIRQTKAVRDRLAATRAARGSVVRSYVHNTCAHFLCTRCVHENCGSMSAQVRVGVERGSGRFGVPALDP